MADFMNFPTAREHVLSAGNTTIGVIPDLCFVSHFQAGPWQILYRPMETGNIRRWGLPLMIPNFSRLVDGLFKEKGTSLPIHGFGRILPWTLVEETPTSISMQLQSSEATRPSYPYEFTFTSMVEVSEATLTYTLTMENRSDENMPVAPGFHPYIAVAQSQKARVITDGPTGFQVKDFDWDVKPPDTPYPFPHQVTLQIPQGGTLTIAEVPVEGKYLLAVMQVWSEPVARPDHAFICFEPTVNSEDALNRPTDRLNIAPHSSQQICWQMKATLPGES